MPHHKPRRPHPTPWPADDMTAIRLRDFGLTPHDLVEQRSRYRLPAWLDPLPR